MRISTSTVPLDLLHERFRRVLGLGDLDGARPLVVVHDHAVAGAADDAPEDAARHSAHDAALDAFSLHASCGTPDVGAVGAARSFVSLSRASCLSGIFLGDCRP